MKRSTKTILIVLPSLVVVTIILVATGLGYVYYTGNLDHNAERPKGEEFGRSTDQNGCVVESLKRIREYPESTFIERLDKAHIASFATGCFFTCKPSKDFCDGVPRIKQVIDSLLFVESKCEAAGLHGGDCHNVFRRVIKECTYHKQTVVSYPDNSKER
jgi:hypothetical protein